MALNGRLFNITVKDLSHAIVTSVFIPKEHCILIVYKFLRDSVEEIEGFLMTDHRSFTGERLVLEPYELVTAMA